MLLALPLYASLCENQTLHTQSNFRLLIVRLGAMGDILHALPAVTALRLAHPDWHIGWVVEPRWQPLLKAGNGELKAGNRDQGSGIREERGPAMPVVDRLHFAPSRDWKRHPLSSNTRRAIGALRRELRAAGYSAVLDLQGAIRSAVIARMTGCPRRIGEAAPREWPAQWLFSERVVTQGAHVIEQDVELASAVAGDALAARFANNSSLASFAPLLPIDPEAEAWCGAWLADTFPGAARPIALITPGAGWGAKRWPPERYATVAEGLAQRGLHVVVNAGPGEEPLAATIASGRAVPLTATLPQLIALTRRIALCIGGDTGPLHLACALGRPVVGIYGPTDPSRNGPFGTRARVLRSPESRRDHSRRAAPDPGLLTIAPDDVLHAADDLLAEESAR
ncbi:MAG: glycosyltransferase family 9 protein [Terracidiphilus sp.]